MLVVGNVDSDVICNVKRDTDVGLQDCTVLARPLKSPSMFIDVVQSFRGIHDGWRCRGDGRRAREIDMQFPWASLREQARTLRLTEVKSVASHPVDEPSDEGKARCSLFEVVVACRGRCVLYAT